MAYDQSSLGVGGGIWASGIATVITTYICLTNALNHWKNWKYPAAQSLLLVIILCPVFIAWTSWAILTVGEDIGLLEFLGDIAKGTGIICFDAYVIRILGWEDNGSEFVYNKSKAEKYLIDQGEVKGPCPCLPSTKTSTEEEARSFLKRVTLSGIQFLIVVTAIFIVSFILFAATDDDNLQYAYIDSSSAYLWISTVKIVSMVFAVFTLLQFSAALKQFEDETKFELKYKFRSVQIAFLITQPQSVIFGVISDFGWIADTDEYDSEDITLYTLNLVICIEMVVLAFIHYISFNFEEYQKCPKPIPKEE